MEKRATIFSLIFVAVVVLSAVGLIIFFGITAREYNYVQLEVNPRVEFIVDKKFKVVSYNPLNSDAEIILANENFKGMDISSACEKYIDLCAKTGYIDVDGVDNAINLTVIDGITQALDVHIAESIYGYLNRNEIMCAVIENYEDREILNRKRKESVCCSNKYKLITTIIEQDSTQSFETLKNLSEIELIDIVSNIHNTKKFIISEKTLLTKSAMLTKNEDKYNSHMRKITPASNREFAELFSDYQSYTGEQYKLNFNKQYNNWQKDISF